MHPIRRDPYHEEQHILTSSGKPASYSPPVALKSSKSILYRQPFNCLHRTVRLIFAWRMKILLVALLYIVISFISTSQSAEVGVKATSPKSTEDLEFEGDNSESRQMNPSTSTSQPTGGENSSWKAKKPSVTHVGATAYQDQFPLEQLRDLYLPKPGASVFQVENNNFRVASPVVYPVVRNLPAKDRKKILVTGGAGFVGSHLVDRLMLMGHEVTVLDNFFTGNKRNILHWIGHPHFELVRHDVVDPFMMEADEIYHLACPASPPHYQYNPIKTVKTSVMGTINMLGLAKRVKAKFLITSTSEVYGDPEIHPQNEEYWGHVNPIGPRACYDEGKRVAETLTYAYAQQDRVKVRVARIFNTFGPRMNEEDGRVVSNFIMQALKGNDITVYGDGKQTRSFQYVHDLVDGLIALMASNYTQPVNLGNPEEYTIREFAEVIQKEINPNAKIIHLPATQDDPQKRRPDITRAKTQINWEPKFPVEQGIKETVEFFRRYLKDEQQSPAK